MTETSLNRFLFAVLILVFVTLMALYVAGCSNTVGCKGPLGQLDAKCNPHWQQNTPYKP